MFKILVCEKQLLFYRPAVTVLPAIENSFFPVSVYAAKYTLPTSVKFAL